MIKSPPSKTHFLQCKLEYKNYFSHAGLILDHYTENLHDTMYSHKDKQQIVFLFTSHILWTDRSLIFEKSSFWHWYNGKTVVLWISISEIHYCCTDLHCHHLKIKHAVLIFLLGTACLFFRLSASSDQSHLFLSEQHLLILPILCPASI